MNDQTRSELDKLVTDVLREFRNHATATPIQVMELIRAKCRDRLTERAMAEIEATIHRKTREGLAAVESQLESRRLEIVKGKH